MATYTFQNGDGPYQLFPTSIEPESFEIRHPRRTLVADSRSMRRQSRSIGGGRLEASFKFPPMHKSEYDDFTSFGIRSLLCDGLYYAMTVVTATTP